jgi:hypothetical protein
LFYVTGLGADVAARAYAAIGMIDWPGGVPPRYWLAGKGANLECDRLDMGTEPLRGGAAQGKVGLKFKAILSWGAVQVYLELGAKGEELHPPPTEPAKSHDFRPSARPRNARSAALFDRQIRPSRRKPVKAGQRLSI